MKNEQTTKRLELKLKLKRHFLDIIIMVKMCPRGKLLCINNNITMKNNFTSRLLTAHNNSLNEIILE